MQQNASRDFLDLRVHRESARRDHEEHSPELLGDRRGVRRQGNYVMGGQHRRFSPRSPGAMVAHGIVLAGRISSGRRRLAFARCSAVPVASHGASARPEVARVRRLALAELMERVFAIDVLVCQRCRGPRRILVPRRHALPPRVLSRSTWFGSNARMTSGDGRSLHQRGWLDGARNDGVIAAVAARATLFRVHINS